MAHSAEERDRGNDARREAPGREGEEAPHQHHTSFACRLPDLSLQREGRPKQMLVPLMETAVYGAQSLQAEIGPAVSRAAVACLKVTAHGERLQVHANPPRERVIAVRLKPLIPIALPHR